MNERALGRAAEAAGSGPADGMAAEPDGQKRSSRISRALLVTVSLLSGMAPFGTDMYLPSFPAMTHQLAASSTEIQLSLTTFLVGAGVGQVLFGPLSDRMGRFRPLVVGAAVFVAASVAAALAPSVSFLIIARLVQGLSGAAGMVIGRAIISDLAEGLAAARAFSLLMLVQGVCPVIAPLAGSALAGTIGWRGILWIVTGIGAVALIMVLLFVRETLPRAARTQPARLRRARSREAQPREAQSRQAGRGEARANVRLLLSRAYAGNTLAFTFAFATMMAYISASPFLYQDLMGLPTIGNGIMFGVNSVALMVTSGISARLAYRFSPRSMARTGLLICFGAVVVLGVLVVSHVPAFWLAVPVFVAVGSLGLVFGNTTALALEAIPKAAGLGSAFLGMFQFALAGLIAPLVSIGGISAVPLAVVMLVAVVIANAAFAVTRGPGKGQPAPH